MNLFQSFFLGLLQGIAEFLPISSSGHLLIARQFMGLNDTPRLFDVLLHVASLIVILWIFRKRVADLVLSLWALIPGKAIEEKKEQYRNDRILIALLILSTFLTLLVVLLLDKLQIEALTWLTPAAFLFTGIFLLITAFVPEKEELKRATLFQAVIIGFAQGLGTIAGVSRSGITIGSARICGMDRVKAGEYSFLLSIPAILGALVLDSKDGGILLQSIPIGSLVLAFFTTLVVGYFSLTLLLRVIKSGKLHYFSFYLIPLGIVLLLLPLL
ncbi:MAG: undecaprenyl-diphosphate phosphatase [Spirochaetaceae bacterium]|jgi:undecaprenyl-diphosphatase|nr:undecaprenyl-diphosphate phosphatase [Spirochaetaceae bacterium]